MILRVRASIERESIVLTLSDRIQLSQVPETEAMLDSQSCVVLDLRDAPLVDRETIGFLANLEARGIELRNCPPYIREWVAQETNAPLLTEPENSGE